MIALLYILDRLSENSTWRGIILLCMAAGCRWSPEFQNQIIAAGLSLVGVINVLRKSK